MIIYNPHDEVIIKERIEQAKELLERIPVKYCFITGSFLYKQRYRDIDIFVVSRSKKKFVVDNQKARITVIDFNDLYSLFYHSISKSCIAKNILPVRQLKVTLSDYWQVVNEAVPTLLNEKDQYHKNIRFLVLYTEYFRSGDVLDSFQLDQKIRQFKDYREILKYVDATAPKVLKMKAKRSYLKRFFYTQAGVYKDILKYDAQRFLYRLSHKIIGSALNG